MVFVNFDFRDRGKISPIASDAIVRIYFFQKSCLVVGVADQSPGAVPGGGYSVSRIIMKSDPLECFDHKERKG
jgi:hypothetical protein